MSQNENGNPSLDDKRAWRGWVGLVIGIILTVGSILGIMALFWLIVSRSIVEDVSRSAFGDVFGAVDTLFAGLAFAGLIYAIILQSKELRLQRGELQLQREELGLLVMNCAVLPNLSRSWLGSKKNKWSFN